MRLRRDLRFVRFGRGGFDEQLVRATFRLDGNEFLDNELRLLVIIRFLFTLEDTLEGWCLAGRPLAQFGRLLRHGANQALFGPLLLWEHFTSRTREHFSDDNL